MWIYFFAWFGLMALAIANGALREGLYAKPLGELRAHQLSTLIGLLLFSGYLWLISGFWPMDSAEQAWLIGALWLIMTLCFEFLFGHYVANKSWAALLADYRFWRGRLWALIPLWAALGPYIAFRLRAP